MTVFEISPSDDIRLTQFYDLARQVYARDPAWSPHSEATLAPLLARTDGLFAQPLVYIQDGVILARAVAIMYPGGLNRNGKKPGYIGFFECLPQHPTAGRAVLEYAETLLGTHGAQTLQAPRVDNMLMGLLVAGFHLPQTVLTTHNPASYLDIFLQAGYQISERMHTYIFDRKSAIPLPFALPGFKTRPFNRQNLDDEIRIFHHLQQEIFRFHPGWIPRSLEEDRRMITGFLPMLEDDFIIIAEARKAPVGLLVCLPDVYQAARGQTVDNARLISIGVLQPYRQKGLGALMGLHLARNLLARDYQTLEASWIRESNTPPQNLARRFFGKKGREFALLEKMSAS
jgi:GNAT superfamily N-acetyltransferase